MRTFSWLRKLIGSGRRPLRWQAPKPRPTPHWRPRLEPLEDRNLLSAGAFDPTFGTGDVANPAGTNFHGIAYSLAIYSNAQAATAGDLVAAGWVAKGNSFDLGVVRYTPDGKPDATFGRNGTALTVISGGFQPANALAIQGDGKIVAAGTAYPAGTGPDFVVARYNVNGSLDKTFGSKGTAMTNFSGSLSAGSADYARAGFLQPDGKFLVAGITATGAPVTNNIGLVRYNSNGSLDTSFGTGGKSITSHTLIPGSYVDPAGKYGDTEVEGAVLQPDGKFLVSGYTEVTSFVQTGTRNTYEAFVLRYNANGTLDSSFGNGGAVTLPALPGGGGNTPIGEVALESSGEIVLSGINQVALLHPDGSVDTTFGNSGFAPSVVGYGPVAIEPNGDIVVTAASPGRVSRLLPNGTLDLAFGSGGTVNPYPALGNVTALAIQPDGKIDVASGFTVGRLLPGEPEIATFTASSTSVPAGSSLTLTASNITDANPNSRVTQVALYDIDSSGVEQLLGYGTQNSGAWTFTFTVNLTPGTYTLLAVAQDNYGVLGDPVALDLQVL